MFGVHSVMKRCRDLKGVRNDADGLFNRNTQHSRTVEISGISIYTRTKNIQKMYKEVGMLLPKRELIQVE